MRRCARSEGTRQPLPSPNPSRSPLAQRAPGQHEAPGRHGLQGPRQAAQKRCSPRGATQTFRGPQSSSATHGGPCGEERGALQPRWVGRLGGALHRPPGFSAETPAGSDPQAALKAFVSFPPFSRKRDEKGFPRVPRRPSPRGCAHPGIALPSACPPWRRSSRLPPTPPLHRVSAPAVPARRAPGGAAVSAVPATAPRRRAAPRGSAHSGVRGLRGRSDGDTHFTSWRMSGNRRG